MKTDEEITAAVLDIFPTWERAKELGVTVPHNMGNIDAADVAIRRQGDAIFVKVTQMYDAPAHSLGLAEFVKRMTDAVGLPEMVEHDEVSRGGCETCDFGSCYGTEFKFFTPESADV